MPGFLVHLGATALCSHGGHGQPSAPNPRVVVSGQPTATMLAPWAIVGCTLPPNAGGPCASAMFLTAALRVTSNGQPLLLFDSQAACIPTGTPLRVVATQMRVTGI